MSHVKGAKIKMFVEGEIRLAEGISFHVGSGKGGGGERGVPGILVILVIEVKFSFGVNAGSKFDFSILWVMILPFFFVV